jgi:hypothetical protein
MEALKGAMQTKELSPEAADALAAISFDSAAPVTVQGRVTTLRFSEPPATGVMILHAGDAKYAFATAATRDMAKQGFNRFTLQPGEEVIVTGVLAKGGQNIEGLIAARAETIALRDGRTVFDRNK